MIVPIISGDISKGVIMDLEEKLVNFFCNKYNAIVVDKRKLCGTGKSKNDTIENNEGRQNK